MKFLSALQPSRLHLVSLLKMIVAFDLIILLADSKTSEPSSSSSIEQTNPEPAEVENTVSSGGVGL